ncbi:YHS domain-containing (seleno)protein [Siccirubricoccus phaeus]|uniref:YHS domain-containing (seleno)protein n=1 Tax=Siccirubricoccus phaeus TaxID=2595053 RepID=UPI0011F32BCF|nr:YHS domain-containing (seleno)protein [Siccirubricoccus phaeus]
MRGRAAFTAQWGSARWRFASAANRAAFLADPVRYAPAYGGFCAYGMARGYTAPIDPEAFTVVNGRLYLNYSLAIRDAWSQDIPGEIARADAHWPRLSAE